MHKGAHSSILNKNQKLALDLGLEEDFDILDDSDEGACLAKLTKDYTPNIVTASHKNLPTLHYISKENIEGKTQSKEADTIQHRGRNINETFAERQRKWEERRKEREELVARARLEKEAAECTFVPCEGRIARSASRRSLKAFLEDQNKFMRAKDERIKSAIEEQRKKERQEWDRVHAQNQASIKLGLSYRKTQSVNRANSTCSLNGRKSVAEKTKQPESDEHVRSKVSRDLQRGFEEAGIGVDDVISYELMVEVLKKFGMVKEDTLLTKELWNIIEGDSRSGIIFETLRTIIYAIMRISPETKQPSNDEGPANSYGAFKGDKFVISMKEAQNLAKHFDTFYLNKIAQKGEVKKSEMLSHTPKLEAPSKRITKNLKERREKLVMNRTQMHDRKVTLADLLIMEKENHNRKLMEYRKEVEAAELKAVSYTHLTLPTICSV
eukprot:TRINITY_DN8001_c0_g1_i4.p1 TRINITY_DN8001_c0_g1~~TRINITY_DN8001_c0_g1_i4.p1  ORF type:complete len:439 (+),score=106.67 TRINITY_DN8001_c0_g1_i4:66-1382(+)